MNLETKMRTALTEEQLKKVNSASFASWDSGPHTWFWWAYAAAAAAAQLEEGHECIASYYNGMRSASELETRALVSLSRGYELGPPPGWEEIAAAWQHLV